MSNLKSRIRNLERLAAVGDYDDIARDLWQRFVTGCEAALQPDAPGLAVFRVAVDMTTEIWAGQSASEQKLFDATARIKDALRHTPAALAAVLAVEASADREFAHLTDAELDARIARLEAQITGRRR
jgi:hypothetical protein